MHSRPLFIPYAKSHTVEAGYPYIVKWENSGNNQMDPVFTDVTISSQVKNIETEAATFCGVFNPFHLEANDKTKLYLGSSNVLYYPTHEMYIYSFRAYFQLADGITAGEPVNGGQGIKAFVLNFDNEQATGIIGTALHENEVMINDNWFTIDGRKLAGEPTQKGVYINNGRTFMIK